jgi:hypothetical protein
MGTHSTGWKFANASYFVLFVLGVCLAWLSFRKPDELLWIRISIVVPELIIWLIALVGVLRFKQYAYKIRSTPDGKSFNLIANSLLWLVAYIVLLSMADSFAR